MGKIVDAQDRFNNVSIQKDKQVSKKKKNINGFKDYVSLLAPNAQKRFSLNSNLRNKQIKGRATIAAIAAALAIGGGVATAHNVNSNNKNQAIETEAQMDLQSDEVLNEAEDILFNCIFGEEVDSINNPQIQYIFDDDDGGYTIKVTSGKGEYVKTEYIYSKTLSMDGILNNKKITKLMDEMISIYYSDTPTQEELQDLNEITENLKDEKFKLNDKGYIVEVDEKENDFERD